MSNVFHYGGDAAVTYKFESGTYATASGGAIWLGLVKEFNVEQNEGYTPQRYVGATGRNIGQFINGAKSYRGKVSFLPQTGRFFQYAFGKNTDASGTTSTHTVIESGNLPTITFEDGQDSVTGKHFNTSWLGAMVDKFSLKSQGEEEPIIAEVDFVAQSGSYTQTAAQTASGTENTFSPYLNNQALLRISGAGFNNEHLPQMISWDWMIENGLNVKHYSNGSVYIGQPQPGPRSYSFSPVLQMMAGSAGSIYNNMFRGGSEVCLDLFLFRTSGTDHVQLWMSGCKTLECSQPSKPEEVLTQSLKLQPKSCGVIVKDAIAYHDPIA